MILDASAMIALLLAEPGADRVRAILPEALIGAVNAAEVAMRLNRDFTADGVTNVLQMVLPAVVPADRELAMAAGLMHEQTRPYGLSLGDRFCLALARRHACPVMTADRIWADVGPLLGIEVQLIR